MNGTSATWTGQHPSNRSSIPYLLRTPTPQVSGHPSRLQATVSDLAQGSTPNYQRVASGIPMAMTTVMKLEPSPPLYVTAPSDNDGRMKHPSPTLADVPGQPTTSDQLRRVSRATALSATSDYAVTMRTIPLMRAAQPAAKKSQARKRKQCPVCGKVCSRPSTLKTHFLIHTGDNPFKCTWEGCNKCFNVKSNMQRHVKSHQRKLEKMARKKQEMLKHEELKKQHQLERLQKLQKEGKGSSSGAN